MQVYRAIKYIRLSYTDDKSTESDSVANQRKLIDNYIVQHPEIEVVDEKIDDGYSGVLFDRPAFQEMMELIKEGKANCVIVKDLSRLGREYIETGRYMRRVFPAYGVRFIAINDNVDTLNDTGDDLTVSVKNIMNEAYSRDISIKTRSALDVKRRSGDFVGAFAVYGYIKTGDKHKRLEVDEYAANVVQDIFRKRLEGFSAAHIANELNRLGILSPLAYKRSQGMPHAKGGYTDKKDCRWSATTIIRILQDETYTGTLVQDIVFYFVFSTNDEQSLLPNTFIKYITSLIHLMYTNTKGDIENSNNLIKLSNTILSYLKKENRFSEYKKIEELLRKMDDDLTKIITMYETMDSSNSSEKYCFHHLINRYYHNHFFNS